METGANSTVATTSKPSNSVANAVSTHSHNVYNATNLTFNTTTTVNAESGPSGVSEWLARFASINQYTIQNETYEKVSQVTCTWILEDPKFEDWISQPSGTFWGVGIPGAGKTILTSFVISHLKARANAAGTPAVAFFYCRYHNEPSVSQILASLLLQLVNSSEMVECHVKNTLHAVCSKEGTEPIRSALQITLQAVMGLIPSVFIAIDALDELQETVREELVTFLVSLEASLFVTSRELSLEALESPDIRIRAPDRDFRAFIEQELERLPKLRSLLRNRRDVLLEVVDNILEKSDGMFLLSALQISALVGITTIKNLRKAIQDLPTTLVDMYQLTVSRINAQSEEERSLALRAILWVTYATEPLWADELLSALSVEEASTEIDPDAVSDERTLVAVCYGLLASDENGKVRLIHYTTHDFFKDHYKAVPFDDPHTFAASVCYVYSGFFGIYSTQDPKEFDIDERQHCYPFKEYARDNLGHHIYQSTLQQDGQFPKLCQRFLPGQKSPQHSFFMPLPQFWDRDYIFHDRCNTVHFAAFHGLLCWFEQNTDNSSFSKPSWCGYAPLDYACAGGHARIVEFLLNIGANNVNPELDLDSDSDSAESLLKAREVRWRRRRPLDTAVFYGHAGVVKCLLEHGASVSSGPEVNTLVLACNGGHIEIVQLLLEHIDIQVNGSWQYSPDDMPALHKACMNGNTGIIKLLVAHPNIDLNLRSDPYPIALRGSFSSPGRRSDDPIADYGWTPLHIASDQGHIECVQILLECRPKLDVNAQVNRVTQFFGEENEENLSQYLTALDLAIEGGHTEIVLLLEEAGAQKAPRSDYPWES